MIEARSAILSMIKRIFKKTRQSLKRAYVGAGYPLLPITRFLRGPLRWYYHQSPLLKHDTTPHWKPRVLELCHGLLIRNHPQDFRIHQGQIPFRSSGSVMSLHGYYVGEVEYHLLRYILSQLRPGFVMCDVGAHHGVFTTVVACELKKRGWAGTIHSFEPVPGNFEFLKYNIEQNQLNDLVSLHQAAVAEKPSRRKLVVYQQESSAGYLHDLAPAEPLDGRQLKEVEVMILDSIIDEVPRVDLIKIDVQGAEPLVLAGGKEMIERFRPIIVVEAMQGMPWLEDIRAMMHRNRYKLYGVNANGQLCPLDSKEVFVSWDWVGVPQ